MTPTIVRKYYVSTYVVKNCNKQFCPYASALAGRNVNKPDHFSKERIANGNGVIITDEFEDKEIYIFLLLILRTRGLSALVVAPSRINPKEKENRF
ncbi:MAG: hypothetical protein VB913_01245 [Rhodospirillales bacterium]